MLTKIEKWLDSLKLGWCTNKKYADKNCEIYFLSFVKNYIDLGLHYYYDLNNLKQSHEYSE